MAFIEKGQEIDIEAIKAETQLSAEALQHKESRDQELADILSGKDDRILLVIGPCSSDNEEAVLEYARRLADLQKKVADKIFMVMRVYTAKPRTYCLIFSFQSRLIKVWRTIRIWSIYCLPELS